MYYSVRRRGEAFGGVMRHRWKIGLPYFIPSKNKRPYQYTQSSRVSNIHLPKSRLIAGDYNSLVVPRKRRNHRDHRERTKVVKRCRLSDSKA